MITANNSSKDISPPDILITWKRLLREKVLPEILETNTLIFSADIKSGQSCLIYMPIHTYYSDYSGKRKMQEATVVIAYIDENMQLITEIYPAINGEKRPHGGGFIEIDYNGTPIAISFFPEESKESSNYGGIPFDRVFHSC